MSNDSYIEVTKGSATTFSGPDAVQLFRATVIANAIDLYLRTGMKANLAYTPRNMIATAHAITGMGPYRTGKLGLRQSMTDLQIWCARMKASLPVVEGNRVSLANMNPAAMAAAARNARREG